MLQGSYLHHKSLKAAQGIKITAQVSAAAPHAHHPVPPGADSCRVLCQGLEQAIAGTQLHVVGPEDDLEDMKEEAMRDVQGVLGRIDRSGEGVCVQASTLGSLEALLEFLKSPDVKIPVFGWVPAFPHRKVNDK